MLGRLIKKKRHLTITPPKSFFISRRHSAYIVPSCMLGFPWHSCGNPRIKNLSMCLILAGVRATGISRWYETEFTINASIKCPIELVYSLSTGCLRQEPRKARQTGQDLFTNYKAGDVKISIII